MCIFNCGASSTVYYAYCTDGVVSSLYTVKKASAIEIYTYPCLTHSLASKLRRPLSWEVDILNSYPSLNIHLSLVGMVVTGENKVNSYSDQLKLGWVCKFGVEFDNNKYIYYSHARLIIRFVISI